AAAAAAGLGNVMPSQAAPERADETPPATDQPEAEQIETPDAGTEARSISDAGAAGAAALAAGAAVVTGLGSSSLNGADDVPAGQDAQSSFDEAATSTPDPVTSDATVVSEDVVQASVGSESGSSAGSAIGGGTGVKGLRSVRSAALTGGVGAGFARSGQAPDDLKRIKGVGVVIEKKLFAMGITSYEQIANFTTADIAAVSERLSFKGRIEREQWVEQAQILATGGMTEFARRSDDASA
ncbi:MAG: hypothetical protein AAGF32_06350, partial [Pseudomonadota bacterium]